MWDRNFDIKLVSWVSIVKDQSDISTCTDDLLRITQAVLLILGAVGNALLVGINCNQLCV